MRRRPATMRYTSFSERVREALRDLLDQGHDEESARGIICQVVRDEIGVEP